jgi:hypothetical protein
MGGLATYRVFSPKESATLADSHKQGPHEGLGMENMSDSEELVLYSVSGDRLHKVSLHRFSIRPEIVIYGYQPFVWDPDRQHYREASLLSTTPVVFDQGARAGKNLPLYDRAGQPAGAVAIPDMKPPDIVHCGLWHFLWKKELRQYHEALVVRVYAR